MNKNIYCFLVHQSRIYTHGMGLILTPKYNPFLVSDKLQVFRFVPNSQTNHLRKEGQEVLESYGSYSVGFRGRAMYPA